MLRSPPVISKRRLLRVLCAELVAEIVSCRRAPRLYVTIHHRERLLTVRASGWRAADKISGVDLHSTLHQGVLVPTFAAREYDRLQYGTLSLRANQCLQTRRAQYRHRQRAIRIFDRRWSKDAASVHNPNDSGAASKRGPLPSFADQVRRKTGQRAAWVGLGSSSRVA